MKLRTRTLALTLCLALCLSFFATACNSGGFPKEPAATQGEVSTSSQSFYNYFAWVAYSFEGGLNKKFSDFADNPVEGALPPEDGTPVQTYTELLTETALSYALYERYLWDLFETRGLSMTDTLESEVQQEIDYYKQLSGGDEQYANVILGNGMSVEFFEENLRFSVMSRALMENLKGDPGLTDADVLATAQLEFVRVKHILVKTVDDSMQALADDVVAQKTALKDELVQRLDRGEDFDALLAEYGEDPGMASSPEGYVIDEAVNFDPAFETVAFTLEEGATQVAEGMYGFHIIRRFPLRQEDMETTYMGTSSSGETYTVGQVVFSNMANQELNRRIETFRSENEVVRNQEVVDAMVARYKRSDLFVPEETQPTTAPGVSGVPNLDDVLPSDGEGEDVTAPDSSTAPGSSANDSTSPSSTAQE